MRIDLTPTATLSLQEAFQLGIKTYQEGKKTKAREIFTSILEKAPQAIDVLQVLAILDVEDKLYASAEAKLRKALLLSPNEVSLTLDLAHTLKLQSKNNEALVVVDQILLIDPLHSGALELRGQISHSMGLRGDSKKASDISKAVKQSKQEHIQNEIRQTLETAANLLISKNFELAEQLLKPLLILDTQNVAVLSILAHTQIEQDKHTEASHTLKKILEIKPIHENAVLELSKLSRATKQYDAGINACRTFCNNVQNDEQVTVKANWIELLYLKREYDKALNIINTLKTTNRECNNIEWLDAVVSYGYLKDKKSFTAENVNRVKTKVLKALNKVEINSYRHYELLSCLYMLKIYTGELSEVDKIITKLKEFPIDQEKLDLLKWNQSFSAKSNLSWQEYYALYESGIPVKERMSNPLDKPVWHPDSNALSILLVREQGVGDEINFYHNVKYILERVDHVYLACDQRLALLMEKAFPTVSIIPLRPNSEFFNNKDKHYILDEVETWLPVGSIGRHIYGEIGQHWLDEKYLSSPTELKEIWQHRVNSTSKQDSIRIGLCWRSGMSANSRNIHYMSLNDIAHFMKQFPNATFYNLQYGDCTKELKKLKKFTGIDIVDFDELDLKDDFTSTAALIESLDAVFTAGTAVHMLTVALGKPCYVFFAGRSDDDFTTPTPLFGQGMDKKCEKRFCYPPLIDNKYPVAEAIAKQIKEDFAI